MCVSPVQETSGSTPRAFDPDLITAGNYLRLVAAVIMCGLVLCRNDETFFKGESREGYIHTGAKDITGLTLYQYQQLLRYLHLVNSATRPGPESDEHDKCYFLRPLISLLQQAFTRCFIPGKNSVVDEAGVPSRFRCLIHFNKDK